MKSNNFFNKAKTDLSAGKRPLFFLAAALFLFAQCMHAQGLSDIQRSYHHYAGKNALKIELGWAAGGNEETSHFILERSYDGEAFKEAALLFTAEDKDAPQYGYTDRIPALAAEAQVYYRLKIVDKKGNYVYSDNIIIQTDALKQGVRQIIMLP